MWALVGAATGAALVPVTRQVMNTDTRTTPCLPLSAALTATLFALVAGRLPAWPDLLGYSAFAALAVPLATIDIAEHRLPTALIHANYVTTMIVFATSAAMAGDLSGVLRAAGGAAASLGLYLAIALAFPGELGAGDVRLAGLIGWILGWHGWTTLFLGAALGSIAGGALAAVTIASRAGQRSQIPAGPTMLIGAFAALLIT